MNQGLLRRASAVLLLLLAPAARAAPPFDAALAAYRGAPGCTGGAYDDLTALIWSGIDAYRLHNPADARLSLIKGEVAAAELNAGATTAAAKGCKALAFEGWRFVLRHFDGAAFAPFQRAAVDGMRALR